MEKRLDDVEDYKKRKKKLQEDNFKVTKPIPKIRPDI